MKLVSLLPSVSEQATAQAEKDRVFKKRLAICMVFLLFVYGLPTILHQYFSHPHHDSGRVLREPTWPSVPTRKVLEYHPCYDQELGFQCARLSVPLDHFNESTDEHISLAIIRKPARVPPEHPQYGGAILFNPGGPGGSGVGFLLRAWQLLDPAIHDAVSEKNKKFYDLVSFDPRGVGLSEPGIECFDSNLLSWTWALRELEEGILGSSNAVLGRLWSMSTSMGGSCSLSAQHDPEDIKKFVSTASVATDMIKIVEAHGFWREQQIANAKAGQFEPVINYDGSKEKLNYWGFSYGTYLGMTFAAMYPDRINRLAIDGVVDAEDYTKALWFDNLADTEKDMDTFYEYCASAGYPACAIANKKGKTTPGDVKERTTKVVESLYHNPLPIIGETPDVISYSDVRNLFFAGLYKPIQSFPVMANALAELEVGNGTLMQSIMAPSHQPSCSDDDQKRQRDKLRGSLSDEASIAISCSDGDPQNELTKDGFKTHLKNLVELSPTVGPMWAALRMRCVHYSVRANRRYPGPWEADTSFPLLFIGNSADPVTPVRHARKMAKGYKGAKVLEVGGSGHCSVSSPSACARKVVYRYFQHGELPEDDAFCKVDEFPFDAKAQDVVEAQEMLSNHIDVLGPLLMPMI